MTHIIMRILCDLDLENNESIFSHKIQTHDSKDTVETVMTQKIQYKQSYC